MELEQRPRLARGCRLKADTLQIPEGQMTLTGAGLEILQLIDGEKSIAQVIESLRVKYPSQDQQRIALETQRFLARLNERGAVSFS